MPVDRICLGCEGQVDFDSTGRDDDDVPQFCLKCIDRIPRALRESAEDEGHYALGLIDGSVFDFAIAEFEGEWVYLQDATRVWANDDGSGGDFCYIEQINVRLSAVVWAVKNPDQDARERDRQLGEQVAVRRQRLN